MADLSEARRVIAILDRFLGALVETVDFRDTILLVTSDHGNLEDLTTRNHTMNKVPALLVGNKKKRDEVTPGLRDITSISDAVYKILQ